MIGSFYGITALSFLHTVDDKNFNVFEELKKSISAENEEVIFDIDCEYRKIRSLLNKIEIGNLSLPVVSVSKVKDNIFQDIKKENTNTIEKEEDDDVVDVEIIEETSSSDNREFVELSTLEIVAYLDMLKRKVNYIDRLLEVECKGEVLDKTLIYGNRSTNIRLLIKRDLISIRNILGRRINIPSGRIALTKLEVLSMAIEKIESFLTTYVLDNTKTEEAFELMKSSFEEMENSGVLEYVPDLVGKLKLAGLCPTKMFINNYKLIESKLNKQGAYSSEAVITKSEKLKVLIIKDMLVDLYDLNTGIGEYVENRPEHFDLSKYQIEKEIPVSSNVSSNVSPSVNAEVVTVQSEGIITNDNNEEETFVIVDDVNEAKQESTLGNATEEEYYATDNSLDGFTDEDIDNIIDNFLS